MSKVKNKDLIVRVFDFISEKDDLNETVKKIINEYENDNDNDNDNDVSWANRQRFVKDAVSYEKIKEEIISNKGQGEKVCEWCGCKTTVLHSHHHPIPKRDGGTEVVKICSNCHHEFHIREGQMSDSSPNKKECEEIIEYLNQKANVSYKASTKKTKSCIHARLTEGFTIDDFKTVIDKKCAEWIGTDFQQYLRPETLFGTKFESYLNAPTKQKPQTETPDFMKEYCI
ncbi:MAG: phage protein [Clostridia bacterium]|nr:phage protein [Clostridia bacterium]